MHENQSVPSQSKIAPKVLIVTSLFIAIGMVAVAFLGTQENSIITNYFSSKIELPEVDSTGELTITQKLLNENDGLEKSLEESGTSVKIVKEAGEKIPGEYAIFFKEGTSISLIESYLEEKNAEVLDKLEVANMYFIKVSESVELEELEDPIVESVIGNETIAASSGSSFEVNDPMFQDQWYLEPTSVPETLGNLPELTRDPHQVVIAVVDTGACLDHPDLAGKYIAGYSADGDINDYSGHGCAVAGVIAGIVNNNIGITGVAPNVKILPVKHSLDLIDAYFSLLEAADLNSTIIVHSMGSHTDTAAHVYATAADYIEDLGIPFFASGGNRATDSPHYPSSLSNVIGVGALNQSLEPAWFSNFGGNVDIWAPGVEVVSTGLSGSYVTLDGTSLAAPYAAGIMALEMAFCRDLNMSESPVRAHPELEFNELDCYPNKPPRIVSSPVKKGTAGVSYRYRVRAKDGDGDKLTFKLNKKAHKKMSINAKTGVINWKSPKKGTSTVIVEVTDGIEKVTQKYTLKVIAAPVVVAGSTSGSNGTVLFAPTVFSGAKAEYASWLVTHPQPSGYSGCAATVVVAESTKGNFEVWGCDFEFLPSNTLLAWQVPKGGTHNQGVPVKISFNPYTDTFVNWADRVITSGGYLYGFQTVINKLAAAGWP